MTHFELHFHLEKNTAEGNPSLSTCQISCHLKPEAKTSALDLNFVGSEVHLSTGVFHLFQLSENSSGHGLLKMLFL